MEPRKDTDGHGNDVLFEEKSTNSGLANRVNSEPVRGRKTERMEPRRDTQWHRSEGKRGPEIEDGALNVDI
jgi:hypothetical protein